MRTFGRRQSVISVVVVDGAMKKYGRHYSEREWGKRRVLAQHGVGPFHNPSHWLGLATKNMTIALGVTVVQPGLAAQLLHVSNSLFPLNMSVC